MFNLMPLLVEPADDAGIEHLARVFEGVAEQGLGVYERTRDDLVERMVEAKLRAARDTGKPAKLFTLSFHDTMNRTARRDGAVADERAEADRLPAVVALSNRGDANGDPRLEEPVTMSPVLLRRLADAHRKGFAVADPGAVALNQPYLGSHEVTMFGARFRDLANEIGADGVASSVTLGAVQAEFLREYLLGEEAADELTRPGVDWPEVPAAWTAQLAESLKTGWGAFLVTV